MEPSKITHEISLWIGEQRMFFVATAPLVSDGHINVSPKGGDAFRLLGAREAVYQVFTGSGAETAAHIRENGRIVTCSAPFRDRPGSCDYTFMARWSRPNIPVPRIPQSVPARSGYPRVRTYSYRSRFAVVWLFRPSVRVSSPA